MELGTLKTVEEGALLAEKTPATTGREGVDLFGKPAKAAPGKDVKLLSAGNAKVSEDGLRCTAETSGVVTLVGVNKIGVFQHYAVPGDVDYSTGNLTMDGTVEVKGWIRSGFSVQASGDIFVGRGIEDARVEAGANIEVNGGIMGGESTTVRAGGDIKARFLESTKIAAGNNVIVNESIIRSNVSAGGRVEATSGKGCIIGGTTIGIKGVEAKKLGSIGGAVTLVSAGIDAAAHKYILECEKELNIARRRKQKIKMKLARRSINKTTGKGCSPRSDLIGVLRKLTRETALKKTMLENYRRRFVLAGGKKNSGKARVTVTKTVHEGTVVMVDGYILPIKEKIEKSGYFAFNRSKWIVEHSGSET